MFAELDAVALTHNIVEYGLSEGNIGTIVNLYSDGNTFDVEFVDEKGYTIALLNLTSKDVRLVWNRNMQKEISYSTQSTSEAIYDEGYWDNKSYEKPSSASIFSQKFAF